jgi:hypothetical protein
MGEVMVVIGLARSARQSLIDGGVTAFYFFGELAPR